ncbi:hypothetical protein BC830DRAFT_1222013 [Chytriomyces sp. MP71]|nr:hypothetical protein BC830DRAFT_1222013 [Chytriomyces sp. MP71]
MKTATIFAAVASAVSAKAVGDASLYLWPQPATVIDGGATAVLSSVCVEKSVTASGVDITPFYTSYLAKTGNKLADAYGCSAAPQPYYVPPQPTCATPDNTKKTYKRDATPFTISFNISTTLTDATQLAGVDESYTLKVTSSGASITANTNVGANYAVRTLSQLITNGGEIVTATIQDEPAYPYRGFMLDTSRNFFPKIVDNGFKNIVASPNAFWYLDCSPSVKWCRNQLGPGAATFFDVNGKPAPQLTPDTTYENQAAFGGKGLNETGFWHTGGQWHNWTLIYNYDPRQGLPNNTASAIKGGFGSLWSETVKRHNLDSHTFPRVSAIAERLWSDIDLNSHTAYRFDRFRASLVNELGIAAADIDYLGNQELFTFRPEWCDTNIATAAQKTVECCFPGQPLTDQNGGELVAPYGSHFTAPSDYCKIATLYKTNSFTYIKPAAVPYAF